MNYKQNPRFCSRESLGEELISMPSSKLYSEDSISNKWNHFFMNSSASDTDLESNDPRISTRESYTSSSCSPTSLEGLRLDVPKRMLNTDNSPTEKGISLVPESPKRKSDGLCQITLSSYPSTYQHRIEEEKTGLIGHNKMETSRLDDINESHSVTFTRQPNLSSMLNVENFDKMEKLKTSSNENGMLKSVKGTVRGYKNMVRRYSASFNSKGHVIPPGEQVSKISRFP